MEKRGYYRRNFSPRYFILYGHHDNFLVEYYDFAGGVLKGRWWYLLITSLYLFVYVLILEVGE